VQVSDLSVEVCEIYLPPRLPESASGIAKNRVAITEEPIGDIARARLTSRIPVNERYERKRSNTRRNLQPDIEQCFVDITAKKSVALAPAVSRADAIELMSTGSCENAGAVCVGPEWKGGRRTIVISCR
jgi:hypothetical protein